MKKQFVITVLIVMLAVAGGLFAKAMALPEDSDRSPRVEQAENGPSFGHHGHHGRMELLASVLDLTDAQKAKVKEILTTEREGMRPWFKQLKESRKELFAATQDGTFDEAKVRALATRQAQARTELMVSRARVQSEIFAILTPEQQTLAKKLRPLLDKPMRRHGGF